ncbi:hypothetical protein P7245_22390 [Vibrio parahaemolyticus]|nr:hypothetical protein [Vibrio parahaemolyticus]
MLSEENVIEINKILVLCNAPRLNEKSEIKYLNAIGAEIIEPCDNYKISQTVLLDRLKNQTGERNYSQLSRLKKLAEANGCTLTDKKPEVKENQTTKIYGFSL